MCYIYAENDEWKDVFNSQNNDISIAEKFKSLGQSLLENMPENEVEFSFADHQKELFKEYFNGKYKTFSWLEEGNESIVRRMGIIATRIAMVLTMIRNIGQINVDKLYCSDDDFENALDIIDVLLKHTETALQFIPKSNLNVRFKSNTTKNFFLDLPNEFKREEILNGKKMTISRPTFDRMLADKNMFENLGNGYYRKNNIDILN
jgi:hypothetical protein